MSKRKKRRKRGKKGVEIVTKICALCKVEKNINQFTKRGGKKKKFWNSYCILCNRAVSKQYRQKIGNKNIAEYMRKYRSINK